MKRIYLSLFCIPVVFCSHAMTVSHYPGTVEHIDFELNELEANHFKVNPTMKVGVISVDYPPFEISQNGKGAIFQGITADYLSVIERKTGFRTELVFYPNRQKAITSLMLGEIDLLASANSFEQFKGLYLTAPYSVDYPALFVSAKQPASKPIKKIALAYEYLPNLAVQSLFSDAKVIEYPSRQEAVAAAVFGEVDGVVIDLVSANYLIDGIYSSQLHFSHLLALDTAGIAFAYNVNNILLGNLVSKVIQSVDKPTKLHIQTRWNGGDYAYPYKSERVEFSLEQKAWLKENTPIELVVNKYNAPMSYIDDYNHFNGLAAEIAKLLEIYSGLSFDIKFKSDFATLHDGLDTVGNRMTILSPLFNPNRQLIFSHPLTYTSMTMVTKELFNDKVHKVAVPQGFYDLDILKSFLPNITITTTDSIYDSYQHVIDGKSDATIMPMIKADYDIARYFTDILTVRSMPSELPAIVHSFATHKDNTMLIDIINKVLEAIPPNAIQVAQRKWHKNALPVRSTWLDYKYTLYVTYFFVALLMFVFLFSFINIRRNYFKRLKIKEELHDQVNYLQVVINSIPHPMYVLDEQRNLILYNDSLKDVFGRKENNELSAEEVNFIRDIINDQFLCTYNGTDQINVSEDVFLRIGGKRIPVFHWFQSFKVNENKQGLVGGWIDISERLKLLNDLRIKQKQANSANREKSRFIASMSHEIRTPMNAILGLIDLSLKDMSPDSQYYETISTVKSSADNLLDLIGDVLDISRIESGQLVITPSNENIREFAKGVVSVFRELANRKNLRLDIFIDDTLEDLIYIDVTRLRQIVHNLVSNSIKFTAKGSVQIEFISIKGSNIHSLEVKVTDTGRGITDIDQKKLFQPFSQVGDITESGTGLGLYICKSLAERMNGKLMMHSILGVGTQVVVQIPYTVNNVENIYSPKDIVSKQSLSEIKILIVDDHPVNRMLLSEQFKHLNVETRESNSAKDAIDIFSREKFDVVITDCNMPDIDGYQLASYLRCHGEPELIIIGFTADAQQKVVSKCFSSGMNDCLFKPLSVDKLEDKLIENLQRLKTEPEFINKLNSSLESLSNGNVQVKSNLIDTFINTSRQDFVLLQQAVSRGDLRDVKLYAHKFKGVAEYANVESLSSLCKELETVENQERLLQPFSAFCQVLHGTLSVMKSLK